MDNSHTAVHWRVKTGLEIIWSPKSDLTSLVLKFNFSYYIPIFSHYFEALQEGAWKSTSMPFAFGERRSRPAMTLTANKLNEQCTTREKVKRNNFEKRQMLHFQSVIDQNSMSIIWHIWFIYIQQYRICLHRIWIFFFAWCFKDNLLKSDAWVHCTRPKACLSHHKTGYLAEPWFVQVFVQLGPVPKNVQI